VLTGRPNAPTSRRGISQYPGLEFVPGLGITILRVKAQTRRLDLVSFGSLMVWAGTAFALTVPLLCLAALPLAGAEVNEPQERQKFVGVWKGLAVEGRGENPDRGPVKLELRIAEKSMKGLELKGTNVVDHGEGEFALDLSQNPKYLDAWKTNERGRKQSYVGIYTLEGDTLRWCVSPRKTRPTEFRTGDGGFLLILKRQKQAEPKPK